MKILAFSASLRRESLNTKLLREATAVLEQAGDTVTVRGFEHYDSPSYNGDRESETPPGIVALRADFGVHDAVILASPEYNNSIPGSLKNVIDWGSRQKPPPFKAKPMFLMAASPGGAGGSRGLTQLRIPLEVLGAFVYPAAFTVAEAHKAFDENHRLINAKSRDYLASLLTEFRGYARRLIANESNS